jgi:Tol biopolymer transport system component
MDMEVIGHISSIINNPSMNPHCISTWSLLLLSSLVTGCATVAVDYRRVSVPQEAGIVLTQMTDSDEHVRGPSPRATDTVITIQPHHWFDISPDGQLIAYIGIRGNKRSITVGSLVGNEPAAIRAVEGIVTDITFSSDSRSLVVSSLGRGGSTVFLCAIDSGFSCRKLIDSTDLLRAKVGRAYLSLLSEPTFSQDGNSLLFSTPQPRLLKYDMRLGKVTLLMHGGSPSYFPDGQRFAFVRPNRATGRSDLWVCCDPFRHEKLLVSLHDFGILQPAVSPDGKRIACVARSEGASATPNLDIMLMNSDGSHTRRVTFHPGHDVCPRWSPDGKSIYFISQRGTDKGQWNIWRMDLPQ